MPLANFSGLRVTYPPELNPQRDAASRVPPEKSEKASHPDRGDRARDFFWL